ncbi:hypothetical protein ACNOYE_26845 [Nannocystaceae bacterium ST9]
MTSEAWSGETQGTVTRVFNNRGEVTSQSINAGTTVSFSHDDGLLLTGGGVTLSRGATTGRRIDGRRGAGDRRTQPWCGGPHRSMRS